MISAWDHGNTTNAYWNSISGMHTFAYTLAFFELIVKGLIVAYLIYDFKEKHPGEIKELLSLNYLQGSEQKSKSS
jgi:hypothetical protein